MPQQFTIVGLGEALFDMYAGSEVLGGSPLNMAVHAHQLGQVRGGNGIVVSRVGQDDLGRQIYDQLADRQMNCHYLQTDPDHGTGKVYVSVDDQGQPEYEIVENVAWDWIQWDPDLEELARHCDAICFSTVAQRHNQSRSNIQRFCTEARQAIRMFDPNLRQSYYDHRTLVHCCEKATLIKLNVNELNVLGQELNLPGHSADEQASSLLERFDLKLVALTRGASGTLLYTPSHRYEGEPVHYEQAEDADAVGAGDACSAAMLVGLVLRLDLPATLDLANHAGAYVASVHGATPTLPESILDRIK